MKASLILVGVIVLGVLGFTLLPEPLRVEISSRLMAEAFFENRNAIQAMESEDFSQAKTHWESALAASPDLALLQYNLGVGLQLLGQSDEAGKAYGAAVGKQGWSQELEFQSLFNQGADQQKQKNVDQALAFYQKALDLNPESREAKINIELLIQDQQGQGKGESQDQNQESEGGGQGQDQSKDQGESEKEEEPKEYAQNQKQKPQFKSQELTPSDVNKILGEILQQEQKIRGEYNKQKTKEAPRDKDW